MSARPSEPAPDGSPSPTGTSEVPPPVEPDLADEWALTYCGFDPAAEPLREALCTLGNGYLATRGTAPESVAGGCHYPGTYVAGIYDRRSTDVADRSVENESIVNLPNWLPLTFRIGDGGWFDPDRVELLDYVQGLDLRRGVLHRRLRARDQHGQVTQVHQRRFVSMADPHVAALETVVTPENWSGELTVRSGIDARVVNAGVARYRPFDGAHLADVVTETVDDQTIAVAARTKQSHVRVAEAARTVVAGRGVPSAAARPTGPAPAQDPLLADEPGRRVVAEPGTIAHELTVTVVAGEPLAIEKVVTLFTSRDRSISEPLLEAAHWAQRAPGFDQLLARHVDSWNHLWDRFALEIDDGGPATRAAVHLHIFHLLQTVSRNTLDLDVGVPARGLAGEAYRGHVFWDELFMFPYLNLHLPELVRSLLLYRYRRLPEARWAAAQAGFRGAMFPWQSGSDGREESQLVHLNPRSGRWLTDASWRQRHIGSAIAISVWRYFQATGDIEFMATYGAELIFEISRFWASIATFDPESGRYDIRGVMGPDEYHDGYPGSPGQGIDNNAYTNVMAAWVLNRALELAEVLPEPRRTELRQKLCLDDVELARWDEVRRRLRVLFHDGVITQFEGYEDLAELDWDAYRARYGDIARLDRVLEDEGDTPNAYRVSKQADVLMLFYLLSEHELGEVLGRLGYPFSPELVPRTVEHYLRRTSHGSTLSRVVHAWVLARSNRDESWAFLVDALHGDLDDAQGGTTAEGVHLGAMAGTVDLLQRCYLGLETRDDVLWLDPHLPAELRVLALDLRYRRRWLAVVATPDQLTVEVRRLGQGEVRVGLGGRVVTMHPGQRQTIALRR